MAKEKQAQPWLRKAGANLNRLLHEVLPKRKRADASGEPMDPADWVRRILIDATENHASDLHLDPVSSGVRVRLRIDGTLHDSALLSHEHGRRTIRHFKSLAGLDPVGSFRPLNARARCEIAKHMLDLRLATVPSYFGEKLSVRILDQATVLTSLHELALAQDDEQTITRWLEGISGLCFVAGPTGCGKTTTLYALLHQLKYRSASLVTIEDPVEYQVDGVTQIQVDPQHGVTFSEGVKAILRLDPDYMMVGELRDRDSAIAAIQASASGHVVLTTLHSRDAASVMTTLRNWDIEDHQIADGFEVVIAQRLVRRLCSTCKKRVEPSGVERALLSALNLPLPEHLWIARGCKDCHETGYAGRMGVFEIWHKDESDVEWILRHANEAAMRTHLRKKGHRSMLEDGLEKARRGLTSFDQLRESLDLYRIPASGLEREPLPEASRVPATVVSPRQEHAGKTA